MSNWTFHNAGSIVFGTGSLSALPDILQRFGSRRPALLTDPGLVRAGVADKVREILFDLGDSLIVYDQAMPEPTMSSVHKCYETIRYAEPDLFIGLGGGSCIDLAKMMSLLFTYGGRLEAYYGENKVPGRLLPVVAIPTTAGTGSEVSPVAIVTDEVQQLKNGISDQKLRAAAAILDPSLTVGLPSYITACTGLDALSQAIEAYFAKDFRYLGKSSPLIYQGSNPMSDVMAEKAIQLIHQNIRTAVHQGTNLEARENMLLGNLYSALAFSNSGTSLIHALAYPVAEISKKPHGEIIGLLLPYVMRYNSPACYERFAQIAEWLGCRGDGLSLADQAEQGVNAVYRLLDDLGMPKTLAQIGVREEHIEEIVNKTMQIERLLRVNPRTPKAEELSRLIREAL
jgi:alcohol dehydrogenase class IV